MRLLQALLALLLTAAAWASEVRAGVSAELHDAFKEIVRMYRQTYPEARLSITETVGPRDLEEADLWVGDARTVRANRALFEAGETRVIGVGRLALWLPKGSAVPLEDLGALTGIGVHAIAVPDPATSPYGEAALEVLRRAGVLEAVRPKLVSVGISELPAAALRADAAIVPNFQALGRSLQSKGRSLVINGDYPQLEVVVAVLKGKARGEVRDFARYLEGEGARTILRRYGFQGPRP
ncbi:molybdate transport system substrate-binding protein [Deinobacterium chartae]|uniref:Molybdate transport system substrate-binding protein n=1 Tax=Deinobacterium chartae TaxID=521158 RepID=A0A841I240_9DEIO|nr:substrate-binding domain-containing protein [Deinobacterium chartae]MBB6099126.1 molybdate transport system substrate-binding protein [Deinobacterium chartae]